MYRRVVHKIIYRNMSTIYFGGLSIKLFIEVSPLYRSEGCPQKYLSEYVHYLFRMVVHKKNYLLEHVHYMYRRVVHKIIYRSMSTIYIRGLSTSKKKIFFWKQFSYMAQACVRESVRIRGMGLGM